MAREITAGVLLKLKDQFSSQIKNAGISVQGFADKAVGVADKVNGAFSGVAGTLGTLGVGIGTAALIKGGIDYQNAIVRIATNAGVYGREVNEFGRQLLQIAYDAKVSHQELIAFASTASECAVGLEDITGNMPFMADVIQALGISGEEAGQLFTTLFKRGVDADALKEKLNNLAEIGDRLGNMSITQFAKFLPSLSETSGAALDNIEDLYIALNMLAKGTNKPQQALQQYQSAMNDFAKSDTRDSIRRYMGFDVFNEDGGLKGFAEIMEALSEFGEQTGATAYFDKAFHLSDSTIKALRQYNNYYQETIENVGELGDTSKAIAVRAGQNAGIIAASLERLKTAAAGFANSTLIKPVEYLAGLLNQHPRGMEYAVYGLAVAIGTLAVMKGFSTVVSFIGNVKTLKNGGGIAGGLTAGGAGIPVHVTNWGGAAGSSLMPGAGNAGISGNVNAGSATLGAPNIKPAQVAALGLSTGVATAVVEIPKMKRELDAIKQNENLTEKERGKAKGGAIGSATGGIAGATGGAVAGTLLGAMAASAIAGTAIGTAVPGLGNIAGLLIGAGVGAAGYYLGGKAGRAVGAGIGGVVADDDENAAPRTNIAPGRRRRQSRPANDLYDDSASLPLEAQGSPGVSQTNRGHRRSRGHPRQVNDLIVTPQGQFSTHPDDYIFAMKNPASLVNNEIRNEVRTVQFLPQATPPVVVEGEIELKSELVIDDRGYRLRQQIGKNTTPYKFTVGSTRNARLIQ
jgi:tetratricopeptide (TPR) repeat protein